MKNCVNTKECLELADASNSVIPENMYFPYFVGKISKISVSPSGSCQLMFSSWGVNDGIKNEKYHPEIFMTLENLEDLSSNLTRIISQVRTTKLKA